MSRLSPLGAVAAAAVLVALLLWVSGDTLEARPATQEATATATAAHALYLPLLARAFRPDLNFNTPTPTPTTVPGLKVRGHVRLGNAAGPGLAGVAIHLFYASYFPGEVIATTDAKGYYESSFRAIPGDEMVTVWAEGAGYAFEPPQHTWRHYYGYEEAIRDFVAVPATATPTASATASATATETPTSTATATPTASATASATATETPTSTATATETPTATPTLTPPPSDTPTPTWTVPPDATLTATPTPTPSGSPTATATATPSVTLAPPTPTPTHWGGYPYPGPTPTIECPDGYEIDDYAGQARPITPGPLWQDRSFHPADRNDWVWFDVTAGQTYVAETGQLADFVITELYVYNLNGEVVAEDTYTGAPRAARVEWTADKSERLLALIHPYTTSLRGCGATYQFRLTAAP